ncbi:amino acid adenylation domain-containing protein [Streptosporangium sp. NPDC023615]|uniref:amino acid adenylation domain-containing protein n=1 Tax=Streptosporangium sp. NPDC023615 TaxID=3154794 RepID=UPI0034410CB4
MFQSETVPTGQPGTEYPLSHGQRRLWFLHRLDPGDAGYNTSYVYRVKGRLDRDALEAAFTAVAARHESLRTRFDEVGGQPTAIVEPPAPVTVERLRARDDSEAAALVATLTNTAFDLAAAPPFRVSLVELGPDEHVLCVVLHHINGDGWSLNVLRSEVAAHYGSRGAAPLPEAPLQYGEYARSLRVSEPELRWWTERLAGVPVLELPADRPRPALRSGAGAEVEFHITPETTAAIGALARRARCTPFMVLFSAYQVLLHRHTGQGDFCVGIPSAGRGRTELENMIGFLSTTLALRCDLSGDPTFEELLRRTRRVVLDGLSRQEVPFERLVADLDLERDLSRTPLFQTLFALHTHGDEADPLPGLEAVPFPNGWSQARLDLSMDIYPDADGLLTGVVIYSTDLFDRATVERLVARFQELLAAVLEDPGSPVSALRMLPDAELTLLREWNDTAAGLPEVTLVDLLLEQAAATPDAVAVRAAPTGPTGPTDPTDPAGPAGPAGPGQAHAAPGRTGLTYAELAGRAAELAGRLRAAGIGRGSLVAVRMERGADMLVALLGVAMSGAAYLPVDPDYPEARVSYVIEDSAAALVLTALDDLPPAGAEAAPRTADRPLPDDTAYVLYTSGSTGRPKGVVVPHRALTNFLLAMRALVRSSPGDVWLALTSLSFDISALELYLPLVTGGRVVVADAETARDGARLARLVREEGVTHVQATPSGWRVLLSGDLPRVTGLTGGEPLPARLARELRPRLGRLVNVYGPTETTIWSTAWEVPEDPAEIVIGHPIANTVVHVADPSGGPCPIGVAGELLIGGAGVATGYLGRPALTAERFVPGPGGSRHYRTGDRVRLRGDGALEFLGRTDGQVKLRGHRIELGEIEAVLDAHPGVRQSVAAVRGDRLVAFVVPAAPRPGPGGPGAGGTGDEETSGLREHAALQLPGYMVPGVFVEVETLPLTPNGKIDRNALPEVDRAPERDATAPRTPAEETVARVFAEVLGTDGVGAHDDFFALGGHSLLATMVTSRLTALSGREVPVREVFTHPTVAGLAEWLTGRPPGPATGSPDGSRDGSPGEPRTGTRQEVPDGSRGGSPDVPWTGSGAPVVEPGAGGTTGPRPRPRGTVPPLSYGQERLWFLNRLDPDDASYNMCLVRRLRGPLDRGALAGALAGTVARHESLRTRFPEVDGAPVVVIDPPGPVPVDEVSVEEVPAGTTGPGTTGAGTAAGTAPGTAPSGEARALEMVAALTNTPFELAARPPLRVTLIGIAEDDHVLCVVLHHILGDGWSLNLVLDEVARLYSGDTALPPVPLQSGDVALWQRGRDLEGLLDHWRERLADPVTLELPVDRPRTPGAARRGDVVDVRLDAAEATALVRLGREHGATMFMVLLAAYQVLLSRHTGQDDILVGAADAGRDRVGLEEVVGYLSDTLVLRGDLSADPVFSDLLAAARGEVLDAFSHRGVPFEELVAALRVDRDLTRTPLFQTMLILHTQDSGRARDTFAGLTATVFDHGMRQAKLELALEAWQDEHELMISFVYDAELFERATVEAMAARFRLLLTALPAASGERVSALPLRTADDDALLARLSRGPVRPPAPLVPELFADAVRDRPDAVAIGCGDVTLGYAGLDARAGELAALLRGRGVVPGDVVGVCLGRSPDVVAALLATWRAGAAYLPLDPGHPAERLAFMLDDSAARLVLTSADLTHRLPGTARLVRVDDPAPSPGTAAVTASTATGPGPGPGIGVGAGTDSMTPDDGAAYVIYTSGSTGTPKGVVVSHRNLAARVAWMREAYGLGPHDRVVQFASLSFDTHAEEIYPALVAGARLELLPDGGVSLPDRLGGVTVLDLPTAYWHALVDEIDEIPWPPSLRLVILGGEQVHEAAVTRWRQRFGDRVRLVNTYGPTEATIIATTAELDGSPGRPPIGAPISDTSVLLLDAGGGAVPPGAPGELCVGGAGVAVGYLNRPDLTAERFVVRGGERIYRTGDRARWRADGRLEFLGRLDDQVKVRGFRIEPGEIEARLLACPGVGQAAVAVHRETLVGYIVSGAGTTGDAGGTGVMGVMGVTDGESAGATGTVTGEELATRLAATLPAHMVPTLWVSLPALPLTSNGKLDRAALPAPELGPLTRTAPRGDAEELVAEIFGEVLGIEGVGAFDDFFALGGHSLLATRAVARLRAAVQVDVPIRTLFARSTVAGLAAAVEELLVAELEGLSDEEAERLVETGT